MKLLIKLVMLAVGVFWLLCLFIMPVYRLDVHETVRNGWMMLNPSGEFPVVSTIVFLAGNHDSIIDISGNVFASATLAILFLLINGFWVLNRATVFLQSPASRFSSLGFLLISVSHILQSGFLLWFFSSLNRLGIATGFTKYGWTACGLSLALIIIMYPLKRERPHQTQPDDEQVQHDIHA